MARYTGPKNRIARRFGVNIFGRARNPLAHKPHPAGMHGAKRKKKSDYGLQLEEKQKLKAVYGMISEKQLMLYYQAASRHHKNTPEMLMQRLECRLDIVVYRLNFASTIFGAQQLVSHGHILVDGKKVDRRTFCVRPGMVVSVKDKSRKMKIIQDSMNNSTRAVPAYLQQNTAQFSGSLVSLPSIGEISLPLEINLPMICDFLSHKG